MSTLVRKLLLLSIFAIAMAFVESAVVTYLRALLGTTNDMAVLGKYAMIETLREAATLIMLLSIGWLTAGKLGQGLVYAVYAFGIWDIFYYFWLYVLIGWPSSILDPDVLFLIPVRWTGPVLAPVLISAVICAGSVRILTLLERGMPVRWTSLRTAELCCGGMIVLYTFLEESILSLVQGNQLTFAALTHPFNWAIFSLGLAAMVLSIFFPIQSHLQLKEK